MDVCCAVAEKGGTHLLDIERNMKADLWFADNGIGIEKCQFTSGNRLRNAYVSRKGI